MKYTIPFQKAKIIATVADRDNFEEFVERLVKEGTDIFRLNCSHLDPAGLKKMVRKIRRVEKKMNLPIPILADLPGPKIRIGHVDEGTKLKTGEHITIVAKAVVGSDKVVSVNFPNILKRLEKGTVVYLDDGKIELEVESKEKDLVRARIVAGGPLRSRVGFSAYGLSIDSLKISARDRAFLKAAGELKVDFVALSFVQNEKDVIVAKKLLPSHDGPFLISKIETPGAMEHIDGILKFSDGIMVARGDLGLALPIAQLPLFQKKLIALALKYKKPVITATQMLESMIHNRFPTRAEVSDVANAVLDGTDAVMLSGETALGQYPDTAVRIMVKIINGTAEKVVRREFSDQTEVADAVAASTVKIAKQVGAKAIVAFSESGNTVRRISRHRPPQTILAVTSNRNTLRQLVISWGVFVSHVKPTDNLNALIKMAHQEVKKNPAVNLKRGDLFIISAGLPFRKSGTTNLILVQKVT
ncbi:MAG: pyruvate kinase [Anaplasmataceae bacterium]|nr:pyruvate kinase [Anaplasmataceae bacterium]